MVCHAGVIRGPVREHEVGHGRVGCLEFGHCCLPCLTEQLALRAAEHTAPQQADPGPWMDTTHGPREFDIPLGEACRERLAMGLGKGVVVLAQVHEHDVRGPGAEVCARRRDSRIQAVPDLACPPLDPACRNAHAADRDVAVVCMEGRCGEGRIAEGRVVRAPVIPLVLLTVLVAGPGRDRVADELHPEPVGDGGRSPRPCAGCQAHAAESDGPRVGLASLEDREVVTALTQA